MDLGARIGRAVDADAAIGRCGPGALPATYKSETDSGGRPPGAGPDFAYCD